MSDATCAVILKKSKKIWGWIALFFISNDLYIINKILYPDIKIKNNN